MNNTPDNWYHISGVEALDSPALVVYEGNVKKNIAILKGMIDDVSRLRIHIKTHKNPEVTKLLIQSGISKFKCATISEAEMLGMLVAPDVLLAYQPVGPKVNRFADLINKYPSTKFSCLVDNSGVASVLSEVMTAQHITLNVYIDLNIGMNRTGIIPGDKALQLYHDCVALAGVQPIGLHAYDGHIHDEDLDTRTSRCNEAFAPVEALVSRLKASGFAPVVVAGGTPTFPVHAKRKNVECSPGTFIYWDKGYADAFKEQAFLYAALIVCRVVSLPDNCTICIDVGHKAVAAESDLKKRIYFLNALELEMLSQSEEHLVVKAASGHNYKPGDVLYGVPFHVCPTVALYERVTVINNNSISGEWKNISRDRRINN